MVPPFLSVGCRVGSCPGPQARHRTTAGPFQGLVGPRDARCALAHHKYTSEAGWVGGISREGRKAAVRRGSLVSPKSHTKWPRKDLNPGLRGSRVRPVCLERPPVGPQGPGPRTLPRRCPPRLPGSQRGAREQPLPPGGHPQSRMFSGAIGSLVASGAGCVLLRAGSQRRPKPVVTQTPDSAAPPCFKNRTKRKP